MSENGEGRGAVLLIDDQRTLLKSYELTLRLANITPVIPCQDSREALNIMAENHVSTVMLDLSMPYLSGEELLPQLVERFPSVPVIIVTGNDDVDSVVECMRMGAFDYVVKPVDENRLLTSVRRGLELTELRGERDALRQRILADDVENPEAFTDIVTNHAAMRALFRYLEAIARTSRTVLVTGETGTGKELVAQAVHSLSGRDGELITVNVAGLDDNAFTDTLFGHKKGAFTGAGEARAGLLHGAQGGTVFLDEIGDLSKTSQVKLLRLLQEGEYFPLGSDRPERTDARFVVATHHDLDKACEDGEFRQDLLYRLQTHHVHIPALRDRREDIPLLVNYFLAKAAEHMGKSAPSAPAALYPILHSYPFPGNVRELEGLIFDAVSISEGRTLDASGIRAYLERRLGQPIASPAVADASNPFEGLSHLPTLKEASDLLIEEALARANNNQTAAAQLLGITQSSLSKRLKRAADDE